MYNPYFDIRDMAKVAGKSEPLWHDANGVPRYAPFTPGMQGVYASLEALFEVKCQSCGRTFLCADEWSHVTIIRQPNWKNLVKWDDTGHNPRPTEEPTNESTGWISWGDAPWHGQCSGSTMTTCIIRIVEYWEKRLFDWERNPQFEVSLKDEFSDIS